MKRFYAKSLIFASIVSVILVALDLAITQGLKNDKKSNLGVWNEIYRGNINSDIIIAGSSRAVFHVNPLIVSKILKKPAYNLGMDGQMFELQYARFKVYLEHNPAPEFIIQTIDCHTFCKTEGLYEYQQFLPYLKDSTLKSFLVDKEGLSKYDYSLPMSRYAGEFILASQALKLLVGLGDNSNDRLNGYKGQDISWNNDFEAAKKIYPDKLTYVLDDKVVRMFEEYVRYCKRHNIKMVLVYTPEYIEGQKFIKNRAEIIHLYERLAKKHGITLLNYSDSYLSMDKSLFYNALHLNKKGAERFTTRLSNDLKELGNTFGKTNSRTALYQPKHQPHTKN